MATDIEFIVDNIQHDEIKNRLSSNSFTEVKPEITADINPEILSFIFSGAASIFFGVVSNQIFELFKGNGSTVIDVKIINENGEENISIKSAEQMAEIKLKTEGSFVSIKVK